MDVGGNSELAISRIAAAIGEPARVRILYSLVDGRARTSTELAVVAEVSASTASVHLHRLESQRLVKVLRQGKHRYYSLHGPEVASALEAIDVIASGSRARFVPSTPGGLLAARTCYDHIAGKLGVALHDRFKALRWFGLTNKSTAYEVTPEGSKGFAALGVDLETARAARRRFAYPCLDWSERQPHTGGALGAGVLHVALKKRWVVQELDSRALSLTRAGRNELEKRLGLRME